MKKTLFTPLLVASLGALFVPSLLSASPSTAATRTTVKKSTKPKSTSTTKPKTVSSVAKGVTKIEVASDTSHYYVLFAKPVAGSQWELPVAIAKGTGSTTVLSDGRRQLTADKYRVENFPMSQPGDVDKDGIDDLTELNGAPALNPLSAVKRLDPSDAVAIVPSRTEFERISYQGAEVARDSYLAGLEFVKFFITESNSERPLVYVMNTETWRAHPMFAQAVGISSGRGRGAPGEMRGDVAYYPKSKGPDGTLGLYRFAFQPNDSYSFAEISVAYEAIVNQMPFLASKLAYYPIQNGLAAYEQEKALYSASRVPVVLEAQLVSG